MPPCPTRLSEVIFTVVLSVVTSAERITHVFLYLFKGESLVYWNGCYLLFLSFASTGRHIIIGWRIIIWAE